MPMIYVSLILFFAILGLAIFYWFWWDSPQRQVPPHLNPEEIKQRELQDRLRQTSYQVLAGAGLVVTFVATLLQFSITSGEWSSDYNLRLRHEQAQQFAEAAKDLADARGQAPLAEQAVQQLYSFALRNSAEFNLRANSMLASFVREGTKTNELGQSLECWVESSDPKGEQLRKPANYDREDAPLAAQVVMTQLGGKKFTALRRSYTSRACVDLPDDDGRILNFEHGRFDNFDLHGLDLSCAKMSQVRLRRASLNGARLFGADLRGARFADWDIPDSPAATGWLKWERFTTARIGFDEPVQAGNTGENTVKLENWKTYRCFITDLRNADLRGADLEGADLSGADLTDADLTGANLCGATISRANFTRAQAPDTEMMKKTCVGWRDDDDSTLASIQPIGLEQVFTKDFERIGACPTPACKPRTREDRDAAFARINRPRLWPRWPNEK